MMLKDYFLGDDAPLNEEQADARRRMARSLLTQNYSPRNVGEGLHSAGRSILGALMMRQADRSGANMDGLQEVAASGQPVPPDVIQALLSGAPNYARGTGFHPGGMAVVGERGPEVVQMPFGAQVTPAQMQDGYSSPVQPDDRLRQEMGDEMFNQYLQMDDRQRLDFLNDPENGFVPPAPDGFSPHVQPDSMELMTSLQPQTSFDDSRAFQTADLDAHRMMELQPNYGAPAEADLNTTEGGRLALLRRMMFADAALEDPRLAQAMTRLDNNIAGRLGALGRLYTDENFELGNLMSETFANAVLRNDSGAQAPEPEVQRYARQYFPLPNEGPQELQAKRALRRETIRALQQALGGDARPAVQQVIAEIDELKRLADVPDGTFDGTAAAPSADGDGWTEINGIRVRVKQ